MPSLFLQGQQALNICGLKHAVKLLIMQYLFPCSRAVTCTALDPAVVQHICYDLNLDGFIISQTEEAWTLATLGLLMFRGWLYHQRGAFTPLLSLIFGYSLPHCCLALLLGYMLDKMMLDQASVN